MVEELKALFGSMNDPGTAYDPNYSDDWNDDAAAFLRKNGQELIEAVADSERLDWVIRNPIYRVMGQDNEHGWSVMDQSNGLSFVVRGLPAYRQAIDLARTKAGAGESE